jgi:hypothetical protein
MLGHQLIMVLLIEKNHAIFENVETCVLKSIFLIIIIISFHNFVIKIISLSFIYKKSIFENEIRMMTSKI